MSLETNCIDCGAFFSNPHYQYRKCTACRDRDQNYQERALQKSLDADLDYYEETGE